MDGAARGGTVAITGASGQVGTLLQQRLAARPNRVRPLGRSDDWTTAISSASLLAHLAGTLQPLGANTYESANVDPTRTVARAAAGAGVERMVFLSYVGADPGSQNEYLRAKAAAERILRESGLPVTILRCLHIYGPPSRPGPTASAFLKPRHGPVTVLGSGRQRIAPLFIDDVVEAVLRALLDPEAPTGTFELTGPDEMTIDDFVRRLNAGSKLRIAHLPERVARLIGRASPKLTPALVDLLIRDNVATGGDSAVDALGLGLHRLDEGWGRGGAGTAGV